MKTRPVLTINQVYDIICKYQECKDWLKAFTSTLPKRKGAQQIQSGNEEQNAIKIEDHKPDSSSVEIIPIN